MQIIRLGYEGYRTMLQTQMETARFLAQALEDSGNSLFFSSLLWGLVRGGRDLKNLRSSFAFYAPAVTAKTGNTVLDFLT